MKKTLKKYFIPHPENDHKPHFLREKSVLTTALVAVILFFASIFGNYVVRTTPQLASIKSAFLVDLTNRDRVKEGLPELSINQNLVAAASMKANDMAEKGYFAHQSPDGRNPWDFIKAAGYSYVYAGENLAVNFSDSAEVERAWMDSPTHKKNILNSKYTEIGIATAPGVYKGDNTTFVVQMFGRPKGTTATESTPSVTPSPQTVEQLAVSPSNSAEADNVLGEETSLAAVKPGAPVEIAAVAPYTAPSSENVESEKFVEFTNPEATPEEVAGASSPVVSENVPTYTNWFERLIVSPSKVVQDLYKVLFAIVVFSLVLKVFIEIRLQHPKNIAYGLALLAVIFVFMSMNSSLSNVTQVAMNAEVQGN